MTKPDRKQLRLSMSADVLEDFKAYKKRVEYETGLELTDSEFLLALLRRELKRRQGDA